MKVCFWLQNCYHAILSRIILIIDFMVSTTSPIPEWETCYDVISYIYIWACFSRLVRFVILTIPWFQYTNWIPAFETINNLHHRSTQMLFWWRLNLLYFYFSPILFYLSRKGVPSRFHDNHGFNFLNNVPFATNSNKNVRGLKWKCFWSRGWSENP